MNEPPNSSAPPPGPLEPPPDMASQQWAIPPVAGPAPGISFGGFWIRFGAYVIDGLILGVVGILVGLASAIVIGSVESAQGWLDLIGLVISAGYFSWFWARGGSTPGMSLLGLQVVRDSDGGPISWGRSLLRYVGLVISFLVLFIGVIWVAFDQRKRGWHDLIAGTVVIRKPDVPLTGGRKALAIGAIGCGCLLPILAIAAIVALLFTGPIVQDIFSGVADDLSRGPDGQVEQPIEIPFGSLRVGDCFELTNPAVPSIAVVRAVPCADQHVYEVFFVGDMPDGAYPGDAAVSTFANENCLPAFEAYVGVPFEESIWYASPVGPTEDDWASGSRRVTCQLHNQAETPVSGSARDAGE